MVLELPFQDIQGLVSEVIFLILTQGHRWQSYQTIKVLDYIKDPQLDHNVYPKQVASIPEISELTLKRERPCYQ